MDDPAVVGLSTAAVGGFSSTSITGAVSGTVGGVSSGEEAIVRWVYFSTDVFKDPYTPPWSI